ncbi:hypothetical protein ACQKWADRAFT_307136 [Trichoderma austrokoningii]
MLFVLRLQDRWLKLCDLAEKHLAEFRLNQLCLEGKSPEVMCRLAKDAQKWASFAASCRPKFTRPEFLLQITVNATTRIRHQRSFSS